MDRPIDLILLTGFLGSGKTTLMNHLLSRHWEGRVGLLINDFGTVNVDGALIRRAVPGSQTGESDEDLEVFEVADGSIFCTCKSASFVMGLRMFARMSDDRRPARLLVEASGMSDPSGLAKLLRENRLAGDYRITRVVCMVDPVSFPKLQATLPAIRRQLEAADLVVLNKTDLVSAQETESLHETVAAINPSALVVHAVHAQIPQDLLDATGSMELNGELVSCSTPWTRPAAMTLTGPHLRRAAVQEFLQATLLITYRIKGWLLVDEAWWFISDNSGRIEWTASEPPAGVEAGLTVICPPDGGEQVAAFWRRVTNQDGISQPLAPQSPHKG